jgi:hypothetical protein
LEARVLTAERRERKPFHRRPSRQGAAPPPCDRSSAMRRVGTRVLKGPLSGATTHAGPSDDGPPGASVAWVVWEALAPHFRDAFGIGDEADDKGCVRFGETRGQSDLR